MSFRNGGKSAAVVKQLSIALFAEIKSRIALNRDFSTGNFVLDCLNLMDVLKLGAKNAYFAVVALRKPVKPCSVTFPPR